MSAALFPCAPPSPAQRPTLNTKRLFEQTKSVFQRWLFYGLGTVFSLAVLSFMVTLSAKVVEAVSLSILAKYGAMLATCTVGAGEGITSMAMQQGGLGLILSTLIISAPPMAAAFFQGLLGQFQYMSPFGQIGRGTGHDAYAQGQRGAMGGVYGNQDKDVGFKA